MADVKFAVVREAIRTDTGTEDWTVAGFGTVKAAIFIPTLCVTDSTVVADASIGWGVTDGTGNFGIAVSDEDAATTSNTNRGISSTKCLYALQGDGTLAYEGDFDSFITDGVRVDITTNTSAIAAFVTCILIGGDDVAEVGVGTYLNSNGGNTYAGLGFSAAPSVAFLCNRADAATSGIAAHASFHLGVVDFNGNQAGSTWGSNNSSSAANANSETFAAGTVASSQAQSISGATQWESYLDNPVADGWDVNINTGSPGGDLTVYLALGFTNSPGVQVFSDTMPTTTTGTFDYSGASFTPGFMFGVQTEDTAFDTFTATASTAILTADATRQYCNAISIEDDAADMNTATISGATLYDSLNAGTVESYVATLTGFTSDGYDADFTVTQPASTPHLMWGILIEEASAGGVTPEIVPPLAMRSYRHSGRYV